MVIFYPLHFNRLLIYCEQFLCFRPPAHNYAGRADGNSHSNGESNGISPHSGDDDGGDSDNEEGDVSPIARDELAKGEKLLECSHMTPGQRKRYRIVTYCDHEKDARDYIRDFI